MSKIADRIKDLMDRIQRLMEMQEHINDAPAMQMMLGHINVYWEHMNDEDKDYIHVVTDAMKEGREWTV